MPRPKGQTSLSKNQLQLAIALSSSLEESKTRELSIQAEELTASAIEDGSVPQNIKRMQKQFLERLQAPIRPGPSKRSKKVPSGSVVPALLSRCSEERLRILTEKVALILIQEDKVDWAAPTIALQNDKENENRLWEKSSSLPLEDDRSSYYLDSIALFVPPSDVVVGTKLTGLAALPGSLQTPVACRSNLNTSSSSQFETQKKLGSNEWSHFHQFSPKSSDQDFDAQTEMVNDWERMVNKKTMSDVTIKVKNGIKLSAHKLVLCVRCPDMYNDLDKSNRLLWDNVTKREALAFLEFIYCGKLMGTRNLRPDVQGVESLARKYNVTELLKLIVTFDSSDALSPGVNDQPLFEVTNKNDSQDIFLDVDIDTNMPDSCQNIDSSQSEDDRLLKDFFGTYNPTPPTSQSSIPVSVFQIDNSTCDEQATASSGHENTVSSTLHQSETPVLPSEMFDLTSSPEHHLEQIDQLESFNRTDNQQDHIAISSDEEIMPEARTSISPTSVDQSDCTFSPVISKRKLSSCDDSVEQSPTSKKVCIKELIEICSSDESIGSYSPKASINPDIFNLNNSVEHCGIEINKSDTSLDQSFDSTIKNHHFSTPQPSINMSRQISEDSFNSTIEQNNEIQSHDPISLLNKSLDATIIDHQFSTPLLPKDKPMDKTTAKVSLTHEQKLLEDSFVFDLNDSYLLRELDAKQTLAMVPNAIHLRTPLDDVKTTSPVTPLPDFSAMSDHQFQTELCKYGLKRNMSKNRGVKMLKYIYAQMHPIAELIDVHGKQVYIPIGDKTPVASTSAVVPLPDASNDESSSSDEDVAPVLEETIFDHEEQFSQEVLGVSDIKTAVKTWIINHPELYERILRYEPIWIESILIELKEYLNKNIKLNQLMDVLDEEGITFRLVQGARNVVRRKSPKKKANIKKKIT